MCSGSRWEFQFSRLCFSEWLLRFKQHPAKWVETRKTDSADRLIEELRGDEAIAEADTILLTVPNQLGVDYNAHVLEAILTQVAPALGWR